jgi:peptidoglycan/LPS O-acetylase OafA/YrhL
VVVFFVLSGYLITRVVWRRSDGPVISGYLSFVGRRAARLYPALLGLVVVGTPVMAILGPETGLQWSTNAGYVLTQTTAFWIVGHHHVVEPWLPTWSLTVEWVFYLTWPWVLLALKDRGTSVAGCRRFALSTAVLLYAVSLPLEPGLFYGLPVANISAMLVGAALALQHAHPHAARLSGRDPYILDLAFLTFVLMVFLPNAALSGAWLYRVTQFPFAIVVTYLVIDQRPGVRGLSTRLFESRPMQKLGVTSYSTYLWHMPVLCTARWALPGVPAAGVLAVALVALVPIVWASYSLLERPWLRPAGTHCESTAHARPRLAAGSLRG